MKFLIRINDSLSIYYVTFFDFLRLNGRTIRTILGFGRKLLKNNLLCKNQVLNGPGLPGGVSQAARNGQQAALTVTLKLCLSG